MKENDPSNGDHEKPKELTLYDPENPVFQKLYLCEYLRELDEAAEGEKGHEHGKEKEKDLRRHAPKGCE